MPRPALPKPPSLEVLRRSLAQVRQGISIADARQPDMPLIYVNDAFLAMSGYQQDEILGRNCRFLHQNDDHQRPLRTVRNALARHEPCRVTLRNYRKDGTLFWNDLSLTPVFDPTGTLTHYIGIQDDITAQRDSKALLRRYQTQLRALADQLIRTEETERQRMACDVHDRVAQTLSLCRMQLGQLTHDLSLDPDTQPTLASVCQLVESAINESRSLMQELSPPLLDELGLLPALGSLGEQLARRYNVPVFVTSALTRPLDLTDELERMIFRTTRELIVNAGKHASAHSITVHLAANSRHLLLSVADDGRGLPPHTKSARTRSEGFGLFSIRERAEYFGGTLTLRSRPQLGTTALLRLPLPAPTTRRRPTPAK